MRAPRARAVGAADGRLGARTGTGLRSGAGLRSSLRTARGQSGAGDAVTRACRTQAVRREVTSAQQDGAWCDRTGAAAQSGAVRGAAPGGGTARGEAEGGGEEANHWNEGVREARVLYQLALAAVRKIRLALPANQVNTWILLELMRAVDATLPSIIRKASVTQRGCCAAE